ncbi:hypothetical protein, partial [Limosilactobacillus panis]|uniref:hypothetical protein n=2 Tax=Lactobacillaceae TaxID=33958 RepID=UPI001F3D9F10
SKQSITTRLGMVSRSSYTENIKFSTGGFFMEETHDIVTPVFKTKSEPVSKPKFSPRPAVKMKVDNVQLTFFKGASPSLAAEISKVVVRYAH